MATHRPRPTITPVAEVSDQKRFEFFLAASHQLKSPVAIIQWCLQVALERGTMPSADEESVRKALSQANGMSHLITDMLHVLRLEDAGRKRSFERIELGSLLTEVETQYQSIAQNKQVQLHKLALESGLAVLADRTYLKQAVINLVDNGIKYTPAGHQVTFGARKADDEIQITVTDQGIGVSDLEQAQLFQEFFRGQEARQVAHEGTGLGLVLVKHIAEEFGGRVTLESKLGQGSSFTLHLPAI